MITEEEMTPIQPAQRINEIDIIRGFALFGILMVNMSFFKYPVFFERFPSLAEPGLQQAAAWLIQLLFTGKFYAIFSFLFGLGFYIFMERTEAKGLQVVPLYRRRLLVLLAIGFVHLFFVWSGDILFTYAIAGFILMKFRNKPIVSIRKWIAGFFIASLLLHFTFGLVNGLGELFMAEKYALIIGELSQTAFILYSKGSFSQLLLFRLVNEIPSIFVSFIVTIPAVITFFLCGLYAGRIGVFKNIEKNLPFIKKVRNVGFPVGIILLIVYFLIDKEILALGILFKSAFLSSLNYAASMFIFTFYVSSIILLLRRDACKKVLNPLAATGRMALTNYIGQSVICTLLFYGFGLGLYGKVSITEGISITVAIYLFQVIISNLWFTKFRYGPLEWFWRMLTYKRKEQFLK